MCQCPPLGEYGRAGCKKGRGWGYRPERVGGRGGGCCQGGGVSVNRLAFSPDLHVIKEGITTLKKRRRQNQHLKLHTIPLSFQVHLFLNMFATILMRRCSSPTIIPESIAHSKKETIPRS